MTLNDVTVNFSHLKAKNILVDWHWLIGKDSQPILITSLGDAFIQNAKTFEVNFLSTALGVLEPIASNSDELTVRLNDREFVTSYLGVQLVGSLRASGKNLSKGNIYSFIHPIVLGGEVEAENIEMTDIEVHFSILGQIHNQVNNLPEGTPIDSATFNAKKKPWWQFWG